MDVEEGAENDFNELFNHVNHVDRVAVPARGTARLILVYLPSTGAQSAQAPPHADRKAVAKVLQGEGRSSSFVLVRATLLLRAAPPGQRPPEATACAPDTPGVRERKNSSSNPFITCLDFSAKVPPATPPAHPRQCRESWPRAGLAAGGSRAHAGRPRLSAGLPLHPRPARE